jgi:hypothetical protein
VIYPPDTHLTLKEQNPRAPLGKMCPLGGPADPVALLFLESHNRPNHAEELVEPLVSRKEGICFKEQNLTLSSRHLGKGDSFSH